MRNGSINSARQEKARLVVLGDGLAAGMGHFALHARAQADSFPAQAAAALGVSFEQPLIEPPGLGDVPGLQPLPVVVPDLHQSTVLEGFPAAGPFHNLSLPGLTLGRALSMRPRSPLVQRQDHLQTLVNLLLGMPGLGAPERVRTLAASARELDPTSLLVVMGYDEVAAHVVAGAAAPVPEQFRSRLERLLEAVGPATTTVIATIPDPLDSAYFSSLEGAAEILKTDAGFLVEHFRLASDDRLALPALMEIGYQLTAHEVSGGLPVGGRLISAEASGASALVQSLNTGIGNLATECGATILDLWSLFRRLRSEGLPAGARRLWADYLGGFFTLNGLYPGPTGNAYLANELLATLEGTRTGELPRIDPAAVAGRDDNLLARLAPGPPSTQEFLQPLSDADLPPRPRLAPMSLWMSRLLARTGMGYRVGSFLDRAGQTMQKLGKAPPMIEVPIQTVYPHMFAEKRRCRPARGVPAGGLHDPRLERPLELPEGLEQTLALNSDESYFGDAIRVVDAPEDEPVFAGFPAFGLSGNVYFGGLAMTDSRLSGHLNIRFSEPDAHHVSRFEIRHPEPLVGTDGTLVAPQLFKLPVRLNRVMDVPGLVSSGEVELDTGVVRDLHYNVFFWNTAIQTLFAVNPGLPGVPMLFPGPPNAGSAWGRFDQRPDGRLDFSFFGQLFLPLGVDVKGDPVRLPLPFSNPALECASIVARGLSLHPHLQLSTQPSPAVETAEPPEIPTNTVIELTTIGRRTSFGDDFDLALDELGGSAQGRSHLQGRLKVQFGADVDGLVPISIRVLPPGGLLSDHPQPLDYIPPGVTRGMPGFEENLRFPKVTYPLRNPALIEDPFNLCTGMVDRRTGRVLGLLLHRGMVQQELFVDLIRVEPCTPADTFLYRGPASFERAAAGALIFRFDGDVFLPYPEGFRFPDRQGGDGLAVGADSRLDPFLRFLAATEASGVEGPITAAAEGVTSSRGEQFSYRLSLPAAGDPAEDASFVYTNHEQGATFELRQLLWLSFANGRGAGTTGTDTVTLTGAGRWSADSDDEIHFVTAHLSLDPQEPFVGIQVDGGRTSNANTRPGNVEDSLP